MHSKVGGGGGVKLITGVSMPRRQAVYKWGYDEQNGGIALQATGNSMFLSACLADLASKKLTF